MPTRPPLLFLHGAFAGPELWTRYVAPWFEARGHAVFAPRLAEPGTRTRLRDYVARARAAAEACEAAPVVVGHSLGGFVAQHLAAEGRAAALALVASPGPFGLGGALWRLSLLRRDVLATLVVAQAGGGTPLGADAARRALFTPDTPADWIAGHAPTPVPESPLALLDALSWDLPAWPLARGLPTLALLGDADAFIPRTDLAQIALAYGAETDVLHGMAHGAPIDPRWRRLAWRLDAWLEERVLPAAATRRRLAG